MYVYGSIMEIKDLPTEALVAAKEKYVDILRRGRIGYSKFDDWNEKNCSVCQYMKDFSDKEYDYCEGCPLVADEWCSNGRGYYSRLYPTNEKWESDVQAFIGILSKEIKSRDFVRITIGGEVFNVHKKKAALIKKLVLEEIAKK